MYRRTNILYRVVDALFRNRNLVVITLLCVAIPVTLLLTLRSTGYTASAAISVAQEAVKIRAKMGADLDQAGWKSAAEVHVAQLSTLLKDVRQGGFVDEVFQRAALNPPVSLASGSNDKRIEKLLSGLSVKSEGDNLFLISLNWEDNDECKKLVQAVQQQYIAEQVRANQQSSADRAEILKEQLGEADQTVQSAMDARERFRRHHPEIGPDTHNVLTEEINYMEERLRRARLAIVEGGERRSMVAPRLARESRYLVTRAEDPATSSQESPAQKRLEELL